MKLKKIVGILILGLILNVTTNNSSKADPLKFGVSIPLSGDLAEYGNAIKNGLELAKEDNQEAFKNLSIIIEDNQYNPKQALSVLQRLQQKKISLLYQWGEPVLKATASKIENSKLPTLAMSVDPRPSLDKEWIIRTINHSDQFAKVIMKRMLDESNTKVILFVTEDPYLDSLTVGVEKYLKDLKRENILTVNRFAPDANDFRASLTLLKNNPSNLVGVYLLPGQVGTFYRQAGDLGISMKSFGTDIFESKTEMANANGNMEGAYYPNVFTPEDFLKRYVERYKNDTQVSHAYNGYIMASTVARLFGNNIDPSKIKNTEILTALENLKDINSLPYRYLKSKDGGKFYEFPIHLKMIANNEIVILETSNP